MGCDIHIFTEVKRSINDQIIWVNCDNWRVNPYYGQWENEREYQASEIYKGRNYALFALLAGVRDYSSGNTPVSPPKGMPDNCSPQIKAEFEKWDSDGHTHSWLTLRELKEYVNNGGNKVKESGLISAKDAERFDSKGLLPESWCQATNIPGFTFREWEREGSYLMDIITPLQERLKDVFHLWDDSRVHEFEDKIRIVFWFDN